MTQNVTGGFMFEEVPLPLMPQHEPAGRPVDPGKVGPSLLNGGKYIDILNITIDQIKLIDIIPASAKLCRYGGQCNRFYSVAEHSDNLSRMVPKHLEKAAAIHDMTESYLIDIPRPIKPLVPEFNKYEERLGRLIFQKFDVDYELMKELAYYDTAICLDEMAVLMSQPDHVLIEKGFKPLGCPIIGLPPDVAERLFYARIESLFSAEVLDGLR